METKSVCGFPYISACVSGFAFSTRFICCLCMCIHTHFVVADPLLPEDANILGCQILQKEMSWLESIATHFPSCLQTLYGLCKVLVRFKASHPLSVLLQLLSSSCSPR